MTMRFKKIDIRILDVQLEIILEALELYLNNTKAKYNFRKVAKTKEENIEISAIHDTYKQLFEVYTKMKFQAKNNKSNLFSKFTKVS